MQNRLWAAACVLSIVGMALAASGCGPAGVNPPRDLSGNADMAEEGDGGSAADMSLADGPATTDGPMACPTNCTLAATSCDGNGVRTCVQKGACTEWSAAVTCTGGKVCSGGACVTSCVNQCSAGATYCSGNGYRTCITTVSGCTDWSPNTTACNNNQVCSGGQCVVNCTDRCAPAANQCAGASIQKCEKKATGCFDWGDPILCPAGEVCSGNSCAVGCSDQCALNAKQCMGPDSIQTCEKQASGCTDWSIAQVCASGACGSGACVPCTNNAKRCGPSGNVETCTGGMWAQSASCAFGCMTGMCITNVTCTPGQYRCNGNAVEICNASGTAFLYTATCAVSCGAGLCTGACAPGQKRCNGNKLEQCDGAGTTWNLMSNCAVACDGPSASCALDKLDITVTTDLNGEIVVDGPVTVTSPAKITSSSGVLTIRAKSITVNSGAAIEIAATGDSPQGKPTGCSGGEYGGGGGYGTAGGTSTACGSDPGPVWGSASDAVVAPGSSGMKGYTCPAGAAGGKGGGVLKLLAGNIMIAGQITANGGGGTNGGGTCSGGSGGGSGGGILLAADQLNIQPTALISAAGGQKGPGTSYQGGNGGNGRIKIIYGSTKSIPASGITPTPSVDLMPPFTITSTTHPDQNLFYNDAFTSLGLAWNRSFPSVQGYWFRLNTSSSSVPAPDTSSTFTANELLSLDPKLINASTADYYFHIVSMDAMSIAGKIEQPYRIRVNTMPPTVSSMTHPVSTTWYPASPAGGHSVFYKWTNPSPASGDENYRGYYYVVDHYGDTVPGTSATFLPIGQKQINIATLDDGIWAFHLLTVDTRGYLTSKAAHYIVRLGSNPGNGNVSGQVLEASATGPKPVTGVNISVNRKLLVADIASDGSGNFNFGGNIPLGTWEVSASKAGYQTQVQMVTVPGGGATINFTLVKIP